MQSEKLSTEHEMCSEAKISHDFLTQLKLSDDAKDDDVKHEEKGDVNMDGDDDEEEEEEEEEDEEEFSFFCEGVNTSPIAAEDAFINGQIKAAFPYFSRDSFFSGEVTNALHENLPMRPPVKKVFVETREENAQLTSSTPESKDGAPLFSDWSGRKAVEASPLPEGCKKSNSTGFSKIWRFKDLLGRSYSDGRDTFVFLSNSHAPPSTAEQSTAAAVVVKGDEKSEKKRSTEKFSGKVKKDGKGKTVASSAHELYLKSKAKEERRRSYLPYRPEFMGFFTNVNGGLSKNVHPF